MSEELDIEVKLSEYEDSFDWALVFGNNNPVAIELGCGKGRFIIRSAWENPHINYFGIEKSGKFIRIMKQRVAKAGIKNTRLLKTEAAHFINKYVPHSSVSAYYIFFPDPWPKKRHHKRRLINGEFIRTVTSSLIPGGNISLATDFEEYFHQMLAVTRECRGLEETSYSVIQPSEANPDEAVTSYEEKYLLEGRPIYKVSYKKADKLLS